MQASFFPVAKPYLAKGVLRVGKLILFNHPKQANWSAWGMILSVGLEFLGFGFFLHYWSCDAGVSEQMA